MQYCLAMKRVWLLLFTFSVVCIAVGVPLMVFCALKLQYMPLAIITLFVCHGIWGSPFYLRALARERKTLTLIPTVAPILRRGGQISYTDLGERVGLTPDGARFLVERAVKRGYIQSSIK